MPFVVAHGDVIWPVALAAFLLFGAARFARRAEAGSRSWHALIGVAVGLGAWALLFVALPMFDLWLADGMDAQMRISRDPDSGVGTAASPRWPSRWQVRLAPFAAASPVTRDRFLRDFTWTIEPPAAPAARRAFAVELAQLRGRCDAAVALLDDGGEPDAALALARSCPDVRARRVGAIILYSRSDFRGASDLLASARWDWAVGDDEARTLPMFAARAHLLAGRPDRAIDALGHGVADALAREPARCVRDALLARGNDARAKRDLQTGATRSGACAVLAQELAPGALRPALGRATAGTPWAYVAWLLVLDGGGPPSYDETQLRIRGAGPVLLDEFEAILGLPPLERRVLAKLPVSPADRQTRLARARIASELAVAHAAVGDLDSAASSMQDAIGQLSRDRTTDAAGEQVWERAVALSVALDPRSRTADSFQSIPVSSAARETTEAALEWLELDSRPEPLELRGNSNGVTESALWHAARPPGTRAAFEQTLSRACPATHAGQSLPHVRCPGAGEPRRDWASAGAGTLCRSCGVARTLTDLSFWHDVAQIAGATPQAAAARARARKLEAQWLALPLALPLAVLELDDVDALDEVVAERDWEVRRDPHDPWECPSPTARECRP